MGFPVTELVYRHIERRSIGTNMNKEQKNKRDGTYRKNAIALIGGEEDGQEVACGAAQVESLCSLGEWG